jgi:hypothetical protein
MRPNAEASARRPRRCPGRVPGLWSVAPSLALWPLSSCRRSLALSRASSGADRAADSGLAACAFADANSSTACDEPRSFATIANRCPRCRPRRCSWGRAATLERPRSIADHVGLRTRERQVRGSAAELELLWAFIDHGRLSRGRGRPSIVRGGRRLALPSHQNEPRRLPGLVAAFRRQRQSNAVGAV